MSVYQVEEYYVFIQVPESKVKSVSELLDNHEDMCGLDVSWDGNSVTIDNFDCESRANQVSSDIQEAIEE